MLWRPDNREIVFQGEEEAAEWAYGTAGLYIPVPPIEVLADDNGKLDKWCSGDWQKESHGCICKRINGQCRPDSNPFQYLLQEAQQEGAVVSQKVFVRLLAPSVCCVTMMWSTVCQSAFSGKLWLEEFSIEFRVGDMFPEYLDVLEANGCLPE